MAEVGFCLDILLCHSTILVMASACCNHSVAPACFMDLVDRFRLKQCVQVDTKCGAVEGGVWDGHCAWRSLPSQ